MIRLLLMRQDREALSCFLKARNVGSSFECFVGSTSFRFTGRLVLKLKLRVLCYG